MNNAASRRALALVTLLLTATLSACGGGGGSGGNTLPGNAPVTNPAPAPGGGNSGGTATPNPGAGNPGATPTPVPPVNPGAPPSSPTPTPTTGTTQVGTTIQLNANGRFSLIQLADEYGIGNASLTTSQIQSEAPYYDAVWAAFQPQTWNASHSGMILSRYDVPFEDMYQISGHNLAYFQQNDPSWILYGCDQNGNPTQDYAWSGTLAAFGNDVPLNIDNPDVRTYEIGELAGYLSANGYNAVAIDQIAFQNFLVSPNPNLENGKNPNPGWYGCGVYVNGTFQRVFGPSNGGDLNQPDQLFITDELKWVQQAQSTLGAMGISVLVNHPPTGTTPSGTEATLLSYVDGVVDENGFTDYGGYASELPSFFTNTLSWVQDVQNMGKAVWVADYFCPSSCNETSATQLSTIQVDWALATYAIANTGELGLYVAPQGVGEYSYRSEFSQTYGQPCGPYTQNGSVYMRQFQNGLAVVNASSGSATATLPSGNTYTDIEGRGGTISGSLSLSAADGWMLLLSSGTGCAASGSSTLRHGTAVPGVRRP